jgi:S-adenosylmethionine hydrolase
MKGVLISLCADVQLIDLTHEVPAFDVPSASRFLAQAVRFFPEGSIHLVVVDPGVGTQRGRLVLRADFPAVNVSRRTSLARKGAYFIGPNNGVFSGVLCACCSWEAWSISKLEALPSFGRSTTFDGRDVFAPAAALIANKKELSFFCEPLAKDAVVLLSEARAEQLSDGTVCGEIVAFDSFGNAASNIQAKLCQHISQVHLDDRIIRPSLVQSFQEIPPGEVCMLINSQGFLEFAANSQSAKHLLGLKLGAKILLRRE